MRSAGQVDAGVRDKALCLVEDLAKGVDLPQYRDAYHSLLVGTRI